MELRIKSGNFSGRALKKYETSTLVLVESFYQPNLKLAWHSHENPCFCLVLEGSFDDLYGRKQRNCQPSTLLFRPSDETHSNHFQNAGARCFNIELKSNLLNKLQEFSKIENESVELFDKNLVLLISKLHHEFYWMDEVSLLAIEGLSFELLAGLSRNLTQENKSQPPGWLKKIKDLLHAQFAEKISLIEMAEMVGMHPSYISRSFHRYYHCTMADYVTRLRIEYACRRLSKTEHSLSQIALDAGFSHQSHFSNIFKRLTGFTPAQYRSNIRLGQ